MSIYLYVQHRQAFCGAPQMRNTGAQLSSAQCATAGPGTKRCYQLRLIQQVLERLEGANEKAYQGRDPLHFLRQLRPCEVSRLSMFVAIEDEA